ncbi:MAG: aquaporin, partial [Candidatus Nanopelagicales bacterium]
LTLVAIHIVGINVTGVSVNPARSLGPALVGVGTNPGALGQVWLFIVAPLVGALVAVIAWKLIKSDDEMPEKLVAGAERE